MCGGLFNRIPYCSSWLCLAGCWQVEESKKTHNCMYSHGKMSEMFLSGLALLHIHDTEITFLNLASL